MSVPTLSDRLVRAAVYAAFDNRDEHGRITSASAARVIEVHRLAPLVEHADALKQAETAAAVIEAAVAARTAELAVELIRARREAALLNGRVAALEARAA